jgi:hypothetical protein
MVEVEAHHQEQEQLILVVEEVADLNQEEPQVVQVVQE